MKGGTKAVSVRIPCDIKQALDHLGEVAHLSRTQLLVIAIRVLIRQAKRRGGSITLPYSAHFAADELQYVRNLIDSRAK